MFKIYKSDVPKPINILFRKNNTHHSYNTRRIDNLHTPVGRTEAIYKTFSIYGVNIWNQGRPQDLGGGGQEFFFQIWEFACREAACCAWRSHAHC